MLERGVDSFRRPLLVSEGNVREQDAGDPRIFAYQALADDEENHGRLWNTAGRHGPKLSRLWAWEEQGHHLRPTEAISAPGDWLLPRPNWSHGYKRLQVVSSFVSPPPGRPRDAHRIAHRPEDPACATGYPA